MAPYASVPGILRGVMDEHQPIPQETQLDQDIQIWQAQNRADVEERLSQWRDKPDGMLHIDLSGSHFVVVSKEGSTLRLGLVEQRENTPVFVQSKLEIDDPFNLTTPYNQAALLGLLWSPQPQSAYMAGLGGGRIPMVLFHHFPQTRFECTDISYEVVSIAVDYFALPCAERFEIILQDSRDFLAERSEPLSDASPYDLMIVDVASGNGFIPYPLVTQEFYQLCRSHLSPQGVLVINWISRSSFLADRIKTLRKMFESVYYCCPERGNLVMFAPMNPQDTLITLRDRARSLQDRHQFPFPFVELADQLFPASDLEAQLPGWQQAGILTDSNRPQDYQIGSWSQLDPS